MLLSICTSTRVVMRLKMRLSEMSSQGGQSQLPRRRISGNVTEGQEVGVQRRPKCLAAAAIASTKYTPTAATSAWFFRRI